MVQCNKLSIEGKKALATLFPDRNQPSAHIRIDTYSSLWGEAVNNMAETWLIKIKVMKD